MTEITAPTIDPQDPLPEASWFWRRVFVFSVTAAVLFLVNGAMLRLGAAALLQPERGITALLSLSKTLLYLVAMLVLFYMVAPSAEQIVKMLQTARLYRAGVQFAATSTPAGTSKTVGRPAPAPIPGPGDADAAPGTADTPDAPGDAPGAPDKPADERK